MLLDNRVCESWLDRNEGTYRESAKSSDLHWHCRKTSSFFRYSRQPAHVFDNWYVVTQQNAMYRTLTGGDAINVQRVDANYRRP